MVRLRDGADDADTQPVKKRKSRAMGLVSRDQDEEQFKSAFFTEEEVENAKLTLKHGLPASLVKELQTQGKVKYGDPRVVLSTTITSRTASIIQAMCEATGLTRGKLVDKVFEAIDKQARADEQPNHIDRLARRKKP